MTKFTEHTSKISPVRSAVVGPTRMLLCTLGYSVTQFIIMSPPLIGGCIKQCFCLMSVCRVHGPKSRPRKTKNGTEVARVTRD